MKFPFSFTPSFSEVSGEETRNHVNRWVISLKRGENESYYRYLSSLNRIVLAQNLERPINWQSLGRVTTASHRSCAKQ